MSKYILKEVYSYLYESKKEEKETLSSLFKKSYPNFVSSLTDLTNDPEFMESLEGDGSNEDKLVITTKTVKCSDLIPLQNEIGAKESLDFPLTNKIKKESIEKMCSTEDCDANIYDSQGRWIITSGGKYIVDGHHRWSSVFVLNPDCKIQVKDIGTYKKGVDALKVSQIIIAVLSKAKGKIGSKKASGLNIINADQKELKEYIKKTASIDFIKVYIEANHSKGIRNKESVINKIFKNCMKLQSQGIDTDAHDNERGIMPQFDDNGVYLDKASQGEVKLSDVKSAMKEHKDQIIRWKHLAGLK